MRQTAVELNRSGWLPDKNLAIRRISGRTHPCYRDELKLEGQFAYLKQTEAQEQLLTELEQVEFTRRRTQHILPKGYTKTRRYGGWSNRRADEYAQRCAMLLDGAHAHLSPEALQFDPAMFDSENVEQTEGDHGLCTHCGAKMCQISDTPKRRWCDIMNSQYRPSWYTHSRREI